MTDVARSRVRFALSNLAAVALSILVTLGLLAAFAGAVPVDAGLGPSVEISAAGPPVVDAPVLADPVKEPVVAVNQAVTLYKSGALIPAIVLGVFFVLFVLRAKIPWLRTGNRAAVTAALLVAATMLAERAAAGTTPNLSMVLGSLMAGVLLYVRGDSATKPVAVQ